MTVSPLAANQFFASPSGGTGYLAPRALVASDVSTINIAGGDLTGSLTAPTIAKIQGTSIGGITGTGNAVLSASPTVTGTLTNQGLFSGSGGGGYITTAIDARNNNTNGIQITGASTTQNQEITKSPLQVNWNPGFTGSPGGTFNTAAITAITTSTVNDQIYPWGIIGIVNNHTDVLTTGNPNAVAVNGTTFTYTVASSQASSSWGGNFVIDTTNAAAVVNPTAYMIGAEIDGYFPSGSGTDANAKRIGLLVGAGPKTADLTVHVFAAIDISAGNGTTDNGITFFPQGGTGNITNLINAGLGSSHFTNFLTSPGFNVDNDGNIMALSLQVNGEIFGSASTTGGASMNIPQGVAPTSPANGDIWMTITGLFYHFNGTTHGPL